MPNLTPLTSQEVANAVAYVERLDFDAKVECCGQIAKLQPAIMGAVVQLSSLGGEHAIMEHAFQVMMVLYQCFTQSAANFPRITEQMVQEAFDNNAAMLNLFDEEPPDEASRLQHLSIQKYHERNVLAFVTGYLHEQGLTRFGRDNEFVVRACKAITDAFVAARRMTEQRPA